MNHYASDKRIALGRRRGLSVLRLHKTTLDDPMRMNLAFAAGLIVIGIAAIMYQGITFTTREPVAELGTLHVTADRTHAVRWPPILGAAAILGGVGLLLLGSKRTS